MQILAFWGQCTVHSTTGDRRKKLHPMSFAARSDTQIEQCNFEPEFVSFQAARASCRYDRLNRVCGAKIVRAFVLPDTMNVCCAGRTVAKGPVASKRIAHWCIHRCCRRERCGVAVAHHTCLCLPLPFVTMSGEMNRSNSSYFS